MPELTSEYSSSLKMYVIGNFAFILKRVIEHREEYYYCSVDENPSPTTVRGVVKDGVLFFDRSNFHFELPMKEFEHLECRVLG